VSSTKLRLRIWLTLCLARIGLWSLAEIGVVLGFFLLLQRIHGWPYTWGMLALTLCYALMAVSLAYLRSMLAGRKQEEGARKDPQLEARYNYVRGVLEKLCSQRGVRVPRIIFRQEKSSLARTMIGVLGQPFKANVLMLHWHVPGLVTEQELMGILAHEMRHVGAWDNLLSMLGQAFSLSLKMVGLTLGMFLLSEGRFAYALVPPAVAWIGSFLAGIASNGRMRAVEFKTDALGVHDLLRLKLGTAEIFISALSRIVLVAMRSMSKRERRITESKWLWLFNSHPPTERRIEILRWLYSND
jgi:Zn-dependent protease with chaperone function